MNDLEWLRYGERTANALRTQAIQAWNPKLVSEPLTPHSLLNLVGHKYDHYYTHFVSEPIAELTFKSGPRTDCAQSGSEKKVRAFGMLMP